VFVLKIAYLILCHKNPAQVTRFIKQLSATETDFYIHVDKKVSGFVLPPMDNVFYVEGVARVDVRWATKSMVDATLAMVNAMFASGKAYDYVCLLSGQDFAIKSNAAIQGFLQANKGANFIQVFGGDSATHTRFSKRNAVYYPRLLQKRQTYAKILKRLYIYLTGGYKHTFRCFRRKNTAGHPFYFGSQWWCLTYDCLRWIKDYIDTNSAYSKFFENALTPDECFFQTLFMASPYRATQKPNFTYLEWAPNGNNPRLLTAADYSALINSPMLFARKFDTDVDGDIIDMLTEFCGAKAD